MMSVLTDMGFFLVGFNAVRNKRKMLPDERVQRHSGEHQRLAQTGR